MSIRRPLVLLLAVLALLTPLAAYGAAPPRPRLVVESGAGGNRIYVEIDRGDSRVRRSLLRVTPSAVLTGVSGWDPAGRAAFVTWNEGKRRWFSASQDQGVTWLESRPIETELRLHARAVEPGRPMPRVPDSLALPAGGRLFLVQFRTLGLPEWRDALREAGAEVLNHFPHNAHIVRMDAATASRVAAFDIVERVEPYHPCHRLEAELRDWLGAPRGPAEMRVRAMVFEWGPEGKEGVRQAAEAEGARVAQYWPSGHVLELWVDREQLRRIAAHDEVMWIDLWSPPEVDMDLVRQDSGANFVETDYGTCGQGVRGEVLDNGTDPLHMDFDRIMIHGPNKPDHHGHGTSTYGIVFGNGDRDGHGNAQALGQLVCRSQGIAADFELLIDRFAHTRELKSWPYFASFQTNSWGHDETTAYDSFSSEMDDIIWRLDIAVTQSQANTGNQNSRPQAWAKNIISVGGIYHRNTASTADDAWNGGLVRASTGPAADGRIKPDVSYWSDSIFTTTFGNAYNPAFGGTSAATPEVAGVAGLIVQMWSENVWWTNPSGTTVFERQPRASTIKALLINSARQYPFSGTTHDLTRTHQGWGRPNAKSARERAAGSLVVDATTPLQLEQTATYSFTISAGAGDLKITMVYPDPPGTTSSTLHRINDLSLEVTSPSGTVYHGNVGLSAANWSVAGGSPNTIDTVENVFVQAPEPGTWTIEVHAAEVNQDAHLATPEADAVFSLVATVGPNGMVSME